MSNQFLNHSKYLNIIMRLLGASFVGWNTEKGVKSLRIIIKGKETYLPLEGGEIGHETYTNLIESLLKNEE